MSKRSLLLNIMKKAIWICTCYPKINSCVFRNRIWHIFATNEVILGIKTDSDNPFGKQPKFRLGLQFGIWLCRRDLTKILPNSIRTVSWSIVKIPQKFLYFGSLGLIIERNIMISIKNNTSLILKFEMRSILSKWSWTKQLILPETS